MINLFLSFINIIKIFKNILKFFWKLYIICSTSSFILVPQKLWVVLSYFLLDEYGMLLQINYSTNKILTFIYINIFKITVFHHKIYYTENKFEQQNAYNKFLYMHWGYLALLRASLEVLKLQLFKQHCLCFNTI